MDKGAIYALAGLLALNVLSFAAFGWDKWLALRSRRRLPEGRLLTHAFWGGFPGAKLGQHFFRHKTRKQPFARRLNRIGVLQAVVAVFALVYAISGRDAAADAAAATALLSRAVSF